MLADEFVCMETCNKYTRKSEQGREIASGEIFYGVGEDEIAKREGFREPKAESLFIVKMHFPADAVCVLIAYTEAGSV